MNRNYGSTQDGQLARQSLYDLTYKFLLFLKIPRDILSFPDKKIGNRGLIKTWLAEKSGIRSEERNTCTPSIFPKTNWGHPQPWTEYKEYTSAKPKGECST